MRHLLLVSAVLLAVASVSAYADDDAILTRTTIGDVPRTYTHFMNAQEAALCRANAAAGGLSAYFFNPAAIADVENISGQATLRFDALSRNYLPSGEWDVNADDAPLLFSQAVAARGTDPFTLGFGYSCPSYRSLKLKGQVGGASYEGEFKGSLRFFEVLAATRIGNEGKGAIGLALGIANLDESADESSLRYTRTANMDGMAASVALGMTFDATDWMKLGAGYRFSTSFKVDGEWYAGSDPEVGSGTTRTEPVAVLGVLIAPHPNYRLYASYINEGWNSARSDFAPYYDTGECEDCNENDNARDEFDSALSTAAIGAEGGLFDGRLTLRGGYSMPVGSDFNNDAEPAYRELVPEYAVGFGGTFSFEQYMVEASFARESYSDGDSTGEAEDNSFYVTVGYEF
jgi:hypothetical protein